MWAPNHLFLRTGRQHGASAIAIEARRRTTRYTLGDQVGKSLRFIDLFAGLGAST